MKKLITIITATLLTSFAFAKTQTELLTEYKKLEDRKSRLEYIANNKSDFLAVWEANKDKEFVLSPISKWKNDDQTLKYIFVAMYDFYEKEMNASDLAIVYFGSRKVKSVKGYGWYEEIKKADWVVDNTKLDVASQIRLILLFKDHAQLLTYQPEQFVGFISCKEFITAYTNALINSNDVINAKKLLTSFEKLMLTKGITTDPSITSLSRYLTQRIIDQKLLGE